MAKGGTIVGAEELILEQKCGIIGRVQRVEGCCHSKVVESADVLSVSVLVRVGDSFGHVKLVLSLWCSSK